MCIWNARGLRHDRHEFRAFLDANNIDVAFITETFLTPQVNLKCAGFKVYRQDRAGRRGGGVAVFVRSSIAHCEYLLPQLAALEAVAIRAYIGRLPFLLMAAYSPPGTLTERDLDIVTSLSDRFVVAGDFNAKHASWNCQRPNRQGDRLFLNSTGNGYVVMAPREPTHVPDAANQLPDILDIALVKGLTTRARLTTLDDLPSDHLPVIMEIMHPVELSPTAEKFNYKAADWVFFQDQVAATLPPLPPEVTPAGIDRSVSDLTECIKKAMDAAIPKRSSQPGRMQLPAYIRDLKIARNRARTLWKRTRLDEHRIEMNRLRRRISEAVHETVVDAWKSKVETMDSRNMSDVWRVSRTLSNPSQSIHPLVVGPDVTAFTPEEKATALADVLETTFQPVEQNLNLPHIRAVEESVRDFLSREPENGIRPTNTHEVAHFIRHLGPHKAAGADGIQGIILQHLPSSAMKRIAEIINNILASGHYPIPWKEAHVVLFPKPGKDKTNPSNYRPISLLSCLSKLAERVIHRRLTEVVLPQIRNEQFGFHPGRSTTHQALRMTEDITWAMSTKRVVAAAYLDIERAFDKVWHEGLLVKLLGMGVPDGMIRLISNYLRGRTFKTRVGTSFSTPREIHAGVPQGSIIGPILFNIFINDLPFRYIHGRSSHLYIYADDTALLAMGKTYRLASRRLQSILDHLQPWFHDWRIKVNVEKCQAILFSLRARLEDIPPPPTLFGQEMPWMNQIKYLGIIMDSHLTFRDHIQSLLCKANGLIVRHYPILAALTPDNLGVGLTMYKALIRSVITYAAPAWGFAAVSHLRKLQVIQNQVIRLITHLPRVASRRKFHDELELPTIDEFIARLARNLYAEARANPNPLISGLGQYDPRLRRRHQTGPLAILLRQEDREAGVTPRFW